MTKRKVPEGMKKVQATVTMLVRKEHRPTHKDLDKEIREALKSSEFSRRHFFIAEVTRVRRIYEMRPIPRCPAVSDGQQCLYGTGHLRVLPHSFEDDLAPKKKR